MPSDNRHGLKLSAQVYAISCNFQINVFTFNREGKHRQFCIFNYYMPTTPQPNTSKIWKRFMTAPLSSQWCSINQLGMIPIKNR